MTETKQRGKTDPEVTVTVPPGVGPGELVQFTTDGRTLQATLILEDFSLILEGSFSNHI